MWQYEQSIVVQASKQLVWEKWLAVEQWPQWDTDLIEAALLGEPAVGTQGRMKVADDALVSFEITEFIPEERLVFSTRLAGATLSYTHALQEEDGGLRVVHGAQIRGIFGFFWRLFLHKKIEKTLSAALEGFGKMIAAIPPQPAQAPADAFAEPAVAPEVASAVAEAPAAASPAVAAPIAGSPETGSAVAGDPVENEIRTQDIHAQIERAAAAVVLPLPVKEEVAAVEGDEHTAVVAVSPVVTKKETKRPKKAS